MLYYQPLRSAPDYLMEVGLNPQEHADRDLTIQDRLQAFAQLTMPLSFSHVNRALAATTLERPPRAHFDQPMHNLRRRARVGCLMQ